MGGGAFVQGCEVCRRKYLQHPSLERDVAPQRSRQGGFLRSELSLRKAQGNFFVGMLKLIVAPKTALACYISREFFFIIESLEHRFGWRQLEPWELVSDSRSLRTVLLDR